MTELVIENLSVEVPGANLVRNASLRLAAGELVVMLGPNGAGKTSLIRAALGVHRRTSACSRLDGQDIGSLSPSARARKVAYLPQLRPLAWPNRVRDVVALGRFAHGAALGHLAGADAEAVDAAIAACDLSHLAERAADTLSGGELARMHCACAFAARAPLLIADEPVAALDPRHQFRIMDLVRRFVDQGGGALVVLHDVGLAARYADRLVWMKAGEIVADGPPAETLTAQRLADVYGVEAVVRGGRVEITGAV